MRVLYVWDADYPWDVRTEKVCLAIRNAGMDVTIAARNLGGSQRVEVLPEGRVERLPIFPKWARRHATFPAFFNPVWVSHLRHICRTQRCDLIMVRDIPLAPTAILVAGSRIPVVLDMAENYPAMIADIWRDGRARPLDRLVRNPRIVRRIERFTMKRVTHTLTVVEESRDRLIRLGTLPERVSVVSNTPSRNRVGGAPRRAPGEPLRLVYLGLMELHRGIGELVEAARLMTAAGVRFSLDLIGDGRDLDGFRTQAKGLAGHGGPITFHGRLPHADALRVAGEAHVGVVPHHATEAWATTIPNKLFDYMAAGLAVVTSDAPPAARVVRDTGAGVVFRSGQASDLADKLSHFVDHAAWQRCGSAGQQAIRTRFNWEDDSCRLLETLDRLCRPRSPSETSTDSNRA